MADYRGCVITTGVKQRQYFVRRARITGNQQRPGSLRIIEHIIVPIRQTAGQTDVFCKCHPVAARGTRIDACFRQFPTRGQ